MAPALSVGSVRQGPKMQREKPTLVVSHPDCLKHDTGVGHPESAARVSAILDALEQVGRTDAVERTLGRPATAGELSSCHPEEYTKLVQREIEGGAPVLSTGDTVVCSKSMSAALIAAGSAVLAVERIMAGSAKNAFCAVRPPGHHARPEQGMGFCVFNNIAVAARVAQRQHGIGKVLIVDWDVHHGNGTQDLFYRDPTVFYFSTHQHPWYPGTGRADECGAGKGRGTTLNCPFAAGAGSREIIGAFTDRLLPAADRFRPEFVMISAGFDSRAGDPLGHFLLSDDDFAQLTRMLMEIADEHAGGRVVSALEGGYSLTGLASSTAAHVRALARQDGTRSTPV